MTRKIYVSRQLTHPLHYQSLHSLPHYHTYSYISHQHKSLQLSCLCLLFHNTLRYLIVSFFYFFIFRSSTKKPENVQTNGRMRFDDTKEEEFHIPPYHLSNPLQPLSIFLFLLHIKCIQRMRAQWVQHFQRPRIYHYYSYYPYSYPDWAPRNRFAQGPAIVKAGPALLILCRLILSWLLNSFILKLYQAVYITSNVVVGECSGMELCEINYWIITEIEVA